MGDANLTSASAPTDSKFNAEFKTSIIQPWKKLDAWSKPFHKLQTKMQNKFKGEDLSAPEIQPVWKERQSNDMFAMSIYEYADENMILAPKGGSIPLFAGEAEKLLSLPPGISDHLEKIPEQPLGARQCRRMSFLSSTVPISILTFACQALLAHSV
jgi:hypothetical protein